MDERAWRRVDRPSRALRLADVLEGTQRFAAGYRGRLLTETMLVRGLNDDEGDVEQVAHFLETLDPAVAYLAVPTRPPAESDALPPREGALVAAYALLAKVLPRVELLAGDADGGFGRTGDPVEDLLGILAVHPMSEPAARRYLGEGEGGQGGQVLEALLAERRVVRVEHRGRVSLVRSVAPRGGFGSRSAASH